MQFLCYLFSTILVSDVSCFQTSLNILCAVVSVTLGKSAPMLTKLLGLKLPLKVLHFHEKIERNRLNTYQPSSYYTRHTVRHFVKLSQSLTRQAEEHVPTRFGKIIIEKEKEIVRKKKTFVLLRNVVAVNMGKTEMKNDTYLWKIIIPQRQKIILGRE